MFLSLPCLVILFGLLVIDFLWLFRRAYSAPAGRRLIMSLIDHIIVVCLRIITVHPVFLRCSGLLPLHAGFFFGLV